MNQFFLKLQDYCSAHTSEHSAVLQELERETYLKTLAPQMLCGQLQGQMLRLISMLMQPKTILEIGTFTGYATICMAEGLGEGGMVHTIEANDELAYIIRKYVKQAGFEKKVKLYIGDALELIPDIAQTFDIVFIDAGKKDYATFYEMCLPKVRKGGLLIADNVLWSGKVLDEKHDADTEALHAFNELVQHDQRVENIMLPLRDGLIIARKR